MAQLRCYVESIKSQFVIRKEITHFPRFRSIRANFGVNCNAFHLSSSNWHNNRRSSTDEQL